MKAVWTCARGQLRQRWRALASLALIAGLGGGAAIAAAAGARRAETVYPRFRVATHAFDEVISVSGDVPVTKQDAFLRPVTRLPAIASYSAVHVFACTVTGPSGFGETFPDIFPVASPDGRLGTTIDRVKILSGRPADPMRADEAVLSPIPAKHLGARVGNTLTLRFPDGSRQIHVVGIGLVAGDVDPGAGGYLPVVLLTPAFYAQNAQRPDPDFAGPVLVVRVRGGSAGAAELTMELARTSDKLQAGLTAAPQDAAVARTARFQAIGLAVFAGLAIVTILAIFAQLLARQIFLDSDDHNALRALGMSRRQLRALSLLRVAVVAVGAAIVAVGLAVAFSPLFPIGLFRQLEPSPGVRVDLAALWLGAAGTILLIALAGVWPAWRVRAAAGRAQNAISPRANRTANLLAEASFPPTAVAGVRMALERGHGEMSVPIRTTIFGSALALIALTAALGFGASLDTLVGTPRLSGWDFDVIYSGPTQAGTDAVAHRLVAEGTARSYAFGNVPDLRIGGEIINALLFKPGSFGPSIIAGRRPEGSDEIALGPKTLRVLHTAIGETVPVQMLDPSTDTPVGAPSKLRIVGTAATPQFFFTHAGSGVGAVITDAFAISKGLTADVVDSSAYIRFSPGVSLDRGIERLKALAPPNQFFLLQRSESSDLTNLEGVSNLPHIGAGLLAIVAAATLVHTLVTSARRRRRDLAILRALGFLRRQVALTIAWQATTVIAISLAIGLPLGVIAGRLGWRLFVGQLGFVPEAVVPLLQVLLIIPIAIALANIVASIPARAAARAEPVAALRGE